MNVSLLHDHVRRNGPLLLPIRLVGSAFHLVARRLNTARWRLSGMQVGEGSTIEPGVVVVRPKAIRIGKNCHIQKGALLTAETGTGNLVLGDGVSVNDGVRLDHTGDLTIGDGVMISHDAVVYTHSHGVDPRSRPRPMPLWIEAGAWIGGRAMILPSVERIGAGAVVGAGSVVTKNVPEATVVAGNPARKIRCL